ncbi:hypothetical protein J5N97_015234 [Dioscorea zingiberensis]|uniref:Cytochrome P450 n=1 Tax=Dioscorea zingiberensis TaxID=325984 RepID=A0A9D5CTV0_9LILI|nr:hypothetical protein J5N97_015234 [Dioscorea zingiberensis]
MITALHLRHKIRKKTVPEKLPPGPRGLPLVGSLPFLNPELHRWFTELAGAYGPVAMLYLGTKPCVLISSSSAASEVLRDQDAVFANHDKAAPVVARMASYGGADMLWTAYGAHWRMVRKVTVREMMSPRSIEALGGLRRREVRRMVADVHGRGGEEVEVRQVTFDAALNYMMSVVWGGGLEEGKGTGREFRQLTDAFTELVGKPNVSDFFPAMAKHDVQGVERRMRELMAWLDRIFDPIISERMREIREGGGGGGGGGGGHRDFLQVMVELKEKEDSEEPFTIINIKALIMDLFGGGTDTTSTTLEWAMAELLNDDTLMKAAQEELDSVVGKDTTVEECHLPKLEYLQAVMKEVMRLHPALPLLVPHSPSQTSEVSGYTIPKDTAVFINVWAIQRDPRNWENPSEFRPERFLGGGARKSDKELSFLPFGAGRRGCVAKTLAERMLMHMLASLVHSFEWELPQGTSGVVLTDKYGLVLKMAKPLVAIPKPRLSSKTLYQ